MLWLPIDSTIYASCIANLSTTKMRSFLILLIYFYGVAIFYIAFDVNYFLLE